MPPPLATLAAEGRPPAILDAPPPTVLSAGSTWIVTPTYNERANIEPFLADVFSLPDVNVLLVDDNSPDGTGQAADQLRSRYPRLHVMHRPGKAGLGTAYADGFRWVLEGGAKRIVQLDADRSHRPQLIVTLLATLDHADLAIASRYVPGGRMNIVWHRRLISLVGNGLIRRLLGRDVHDWSTGFKAWRADLLTQVLEQPLRGIGYAWLMETTWWARRLGGRIVEIPLVFTERQAGQSKFSLAIGWEDLRLAWWLHRRLR